jgi:hypothetical protein
MKARGSVGSHEFLNTAYGLLEVLMKRLNLVAIAFFSLLISTVGAFAGDFDGSKPLLFSVIRVIECTPRGECQEVSAESVALPQFLKIDFDKKTIRPARDAERVPETAIERMESVDGKLILQGAEDGFDKMKDGLGWTMAISEETGKVVLTASGEEVGFVVFGSCMPLWRRLRF